MVNRCSAIAVWATVLVVAAPVHAQEPEQSEPTQSPDVADAADKPDVSGSVDTRARELFLRGDRLYANGDYAGAITAFKEAYDLSARPLLLFNLANAYERTGRYELAMDALRRYAPDAPEYERKSIAQRLSHLEDRAERAAAPPPSDTPAPPEDTSGQPAETGASDGPVEAGGGGAAGGSSFDTSTLGWVLTLGGGVLVAAGAASAIVAMDARATAEENCIAGVCRREARSAIDRDATASLLADIGLIAGGASMAAGLVLLLVVDSPEVAQRARVSIDAEGLSLGYAGSF